jgi:hypothetical protein
MREETMAKINFTSLIFLIFLLSNLFSCQSEVQNEPWYRKAVEYIESDEITIRNAYERKQTGLEDLKLRDKIVSELLKSQPPSINQLKELLASGNYLDRKVALVNIMLRHIYSENLSKDIVAFNNPVDIFWVKFYSLNCFKELDQDAIKRFEDDIINIYSFETDQSLLISAMPIIIRLDRSKTIPLFVKYFENGPEGLRKAAYVYAKKMGEEYFMQVKTILKEKKAVGALSFIKEADLGKTP